jgi:hypothetical protein
MLPFLLSERLHLSVNQDEREESLHVIISRSPVLQVNDRPPGRNPTILGFGGDISA